VRDSGLQRLVVLISRPSGGFVVEFLPLCKSAMWSISVGVCECWWAVGVLSLLVLLAVLSYRQLHCQLYTP